MGSAPPRLRVDLSGDLLNANVQGQTVSAPGLSGTGKVAAATGGALLVLLAGSVVVSRYTPYDLRTLLSPRGRSGRVQRLLDCATFWMHIRLPFAPRLALYYFDRAIPHVAPPTVNFVRTDRAACLLLAGRAKEAAIACEEILAEIRAHPSFDRYDAQAAQFVAAMALALTSRRDPQSPDGERCFKLLDAALEDNPDYAWAARRAGAFKHLRDHPRFAALLAKHTPEPLISDQKPARRR